MSEDENESEEPSDCITPDEDEINIDYLNEIAKKIL